MALTCVGCKSLLDENVALRKECDELQIVLDAWAKVFGSSQLSHASENFDSVKRERDQWKARHAKLSGGGCDCWQDPRPSAEQGHDTHCPEQAALLMEGYCKSIQEWKARAEAAEKVVRAARMVADAGAISVYSYTGPVGACREALAAYDKEAERRKDVDR